jgi:hypothetical protein
MHTSAALHFAIFYLLLPLWLITGFADYFCHRQSPIEITSGTKESALHLVGMFEMAVPLLAVFFLEINVSVILIVFVGVVLHEATIVWDVSYANFTRYVSPFEQHLHGLLEFIPWFVLLLILSLHAPDLIGMPLSEQMSFSAKHTPFDGYYVTAFISAAVVFGLLPYVEEFFRCVRKANG